MLNQIATLLIGSLGGLFVYALLLRFHMQWLRAPFRNSLGELVAALTNWIVLPVRRFVPGLFGLDLATLLLAWLIQALLMALLMSLRGYAFASAPGIAFLVLAAVSAIELARMSIFLLIGAALLQAVLSFVAPYSPMAPVLDALTRRFYAPFRRFIPVIGSIDLSPLFLILAAQIVLIVLDWLHRLVGGPFRAADTDLRILTAPWCRKAGEGWMLELHVQPGAKKSEIAGPHGSALKVRIASPPVDGRANDALVAFIAGALGVPRQSVQVIKGQRSRRKIVRVSAGQCDPTRLVERN